MEVRGKISSTGFKKVSETRVFDAVVSIATPAEKPEIQRKQLLTWRRWKHRPANRHYSGQQIKHADLQIADPQVAQELLTAAGQFDQDATHVIGRDGLQLGKRADIVLQRSADPLLVLSDVKIGEQSQ